MSTGYPRAQLIADLHVRLNDLYPIPPSPPRWSAATVDAAVADGLRWCEPVGDQRIDLLTPAQFASQPDLALLAVNKVETATASGLWLEVPKNMWSFRRGANPWLTLNAVPTQSLRLQSIALLQPLDVVIRVDPELIILYALAYLYEQDVGHTQTSNHQGEMVLTMDYRLQAEERKERIRLQQYPLPPLPPLPANHTTVTHKSTSGSSKKK